MQDLSIDIPEGQDIMVLDLLNMAKEQDPSISFRRSCGEGVCGSDGMNINGKNGLGCITPLSEALKGNKIVLRPLPGLPVIKDLIVDMKQFVDQYKKIKPYLINDEEKPEREIKQTVEEREKAWKEMAIASGSVQGLDILSEEEKVILNPTAVQISAFLDLIPKLNNKR